MASLSDILTLRAPRYALRRWLYRGGSPNRLARALLRVDVAAGVRGRTLERMTILEVPGRSTGKVVQVPLVVATLDGERYLVSMLGPDAGWVRNVRAAGGRVTLVHGERKPAQLEEVPVAERAPILKRYLELAPGARAHVVVDRRAPLEEFVAVAARYPVFRVVE